MKRFLVLGSTGLVGTRFIELVAAHKQVSPKEEDLDITDSAMLASFFERHQNDFDTVVNFAALTDVDGIEKQRGDKKAVAWKVNVDGAKEVAMMASEYNKHLIHISTDFVFEGTEENAGPYPENSPLTDNSEKISWYGWTKLCAEKEVKKILEKVAIVRIAFPFRAAPYQYKVDFARKILELHDSGKLYPLFADQTITPLFIDDIVLPLETIADRNLTGIFHIVSSNTTTPYEFGSYLLEKARGVKNAVKKGSLEEYLKKPGVAKRPRLGGLQTGETQNTLSLKFNSWQEMVDKFSAQITS